MTLKIAGAILIVVSCGAFGFCVARNHRREVFALEQLILALDYMESELKYNLSALPELAQSLVTVTKGAVRDVFQRFLKELDNQVLPDAEKCMHIALGNIKDIPPITLSCFKSFAQTLGKFDLEGQEKSLVILRQNCEKKLDNYMKDQDNRLRSYQTLGLCAGAALAILFV